MERKNIDLGVKFENSYSKLDGSLFTKILPTVPKNPTVTIYNDELAKDLGIKELSEKEIVEVFSGKALPLGSEPLAQAYGGHQFGYFNILGDGRANLLGEIIKGDTRFDIQLKGSGKTPYSRRGDGKGTLYSMLREYLISESMNALGIPTTRTLSVISTGETVTREELQKGAVLTRVASSHIRIGTFEYVALQNDEKLLKDFTDYVINRHYPIITEDENKYSKFLQLVCEKQIDLVVNWMRIGFIHGVMNTDNISIAGETIDYGPCAFINSYNPQKVYSSIDTYGRYAFGNQGKIIIWNLVKLAQVLLPLIDKNEEKSIEIAQSIIDNAKKSYEEKYRHMLGKKIGLKNLVEGDYELIEELLNLLFQNNLDYTNSFVELKKALVSKNDSCSLEGLEVWYEKWKKRIEKEEFHQSVELMERNNPSIIPRNHLVENALKNAVDGHMTEFIRFLEVLKNPYNDNEKHEIYKTPSSNENEYKTYCGT